MLPLRHVNPVLFGTLFQSAEHVQEMRRKQGVHYTSEVNILRAIGPLFLDDLERRLASAHHSVGDLRALLAHIKALTFLDPACGCGNFLVVAYRELRLLELCCYRRLLELKEPVRHQLLSGEFGIGLDAFHGIEIDESACGIARSVLCLIEHQMNVLASDLVGERVTVRSPRVSPSIVHGNALTTRWEDVVPAGRLSYLLGNPPFIGKAYRSDAQREEMRQVFDDADGHGELDYACAWYAKAAHYIQGSQVRAAFVSTNSLAQGEQVGILWRRLTAAGITIRFAHRTFRWSNEARDNAHVFVVIIGFASGDPPRGNRLPLYDYATPDSEPVVAEGPHINPYLIHHADDTVVQKRRQPLSGVPPIVFGSMPNDGSREARKRTGSGNLLLDDQERAQLLAEAPAAAPFLRRFFGAEELLDATPRWCLWLKDARPSEWRDIAPIRQRVERVKLHRLASSRPATRRLAETPDLFGEDRQPDRPYVAIPSASSELRRYIPMVFAAPDEIASNLCLTIPGASLYHFGVLHSDMHMAWVRHVCGRLKSDFRYSNEIVYNNFPWPAAGTDRQDRIAEAAQAVLDVRARHLAGGDETLASLYDASRMPSDLLAAHRALSREVDRAYLARRTFDTDRQRMELLLNRYSKLVDAYRARSIGIS